MRTTDGRTDEQTDGQTDGHGDSSIPPNFVAGGIMITETHNPYDLNLLLCIHYEQDFPKAGISIHAK